jgi:glyoxylase-like metal-dependent hydrolase (beta-lactamase superfamily II)
MMPPKNPLTQLADDLYQVQIPLPFALNIVNCYLLHGSQGWTVVDTGINTEAGRAVWMGVFETLAIQPQHLHQIYLTHAHPDHFGMSGWLQQLAAAQGRHIPIYISARENQMAQHVWYGNALYDFAGWLRAGGMPDQMAQQVADSMDDTYSMTLPHPPQMEAMQADTLLQLGDRTFRTILAPGHSDGQILFYDASDHLLLSGDHVLMKITPNIGLWEHSDPDPLGQFMASLVTLRELDVRIALPGHKHLIEDWQGRIDELLAHHEHRLDQTLDALGQNRHTPYEVAGAIFDTTRFTVHEWRFALAETLAHLEYLRIRGKAQQITGVQAFERL